MPARFDRLGIAFQYPDNWTLDDTDAMLGRRSVTVYGPNGALWSVAIHSGSVAPERLAAAALEALTQEYKSVETEAARETIAGHELTGYDVAFYCLDLTSTAQIRCLRIDQSTYTIYCQAEDRELERVKTVFLAMTTSLLTEIDAGAT
ncbi:MAG: hypothetical protein JW959_11400 [Pirellulales bacterium]|nr:hypothetical protein [Pirellulales bacterium]